VSILEVMVSVLLMLLTRQLGRRRLAATMILLAVPFLILPQPPHCAAISPISYSMIRGVAPRAA